MNLIHKFKKFYYDNFSYKIEGYGFTYSLKSYILSLLAFYGVVTIAGMYFKLTSPFLTQIFTVIFTCFPFIVLAQFKYLYNNRRFEYLVGYLEQMIFSFKRTPKILECFKATMEVVEEEVAKEIKVAIKIIEEDNLGQGYTDAFKYMESVYPCTRVQALHSFMLSVEENGGKYQHAIDVFLEDIRSWISRTYLYQKEIAGVKSKIVLSVILSLFIAGTMMIMVPSELVEFGSNTIYLITTTLYFNALIFLFVIVQIKLNGSWLIQDIGDDYTVVEKKVNPKSKFINAMIMSIFVVLGIIIQNTFVVFIGMICMLFVYLKPNIDQRNRIRKKKRAIQKAFPLWLRDLSLQIQTSIVPLAIKESIIQAPKVLQQPLKDFVEEIEKAPDSIQPYNTFLKEYAIPDITNAMKMLYSIQTLHVRDIQIQITALIKRNQLLLEKAEKIRNEDTLAGIGFIMAIPMLFATLKLLVDLGIILMSFMSLTSGI